MHGEFKAFIGIMLASFLVVVAIVAGTILCNNWFLENSCEKQAELMNVDWRYSFMTGCYVQMQGKWLPLTAYRDNEPVWRPDTRR